MPDGLRSAYFFPHALKPRGSPPNPPGRVPFDVEARVSDGRTAWIEQVTILGDGYDRNTIGPNQDPCIVASPRPFHSFCRIDKDKADNQVRGTGLLLSELVKPGDIIVYGKFEPLTGLGPTTRIWVDAVLVVDRVVHWPTSQKTRGERCSVSHCRGHEFTLRDPAGFAARLTGEAEGATTDAYKYNLSDAEPYGYHCCTSIEDYRVILGRSDHDPSSVRLLNASFAPLGVEVSPGEFEPVSLDATKLGDDWMKYSSFIDRHVRTIGAGPKGAWIARFPEVGLAEDLCRAVINASALRGQHGIVAMLPVSLAAIVARVR